jgi:hypothetical protein
VTHQNPSNAAARARPSSDLPTVCAREADEFPHLLSDDCVSVAIDNVESGLWCEAIDVTRDRLRLSQFEVDFLAVDLVDDERGQESERVVLIGGVGAGCDTDLVKGNSFVGECERDGASKCAEGSADDGERGGRHG